MQDGLTGVPARRGWRDDAEASQDDRNDDRGACALAFGRFSETLEGVTAARRCVGIASATLPTQRFGKAILYAIYFSSTTLGVLSLAGPIV